MSYERLKELNKLIYQLDKAEVELYIKRGLSASLLLFTVTAGSEALMHPDVGAVLLFLGLAVNTGAQIAFSSATQNKTKVLENRIQAESYD
ncbi:MAG TPA: hypothetical protein VLH19_02155 [Patescibacteria group bacterium]|nr:hypothetical protein [Patescibacteria group bacterium]